MGQLNVYGIGRRGVNVDKNAYELLDDELTKAQNAKFDRLKDGALTNRDGLINFNAVASGASVVGAAGVPLIPATSGETRAIYLGDDPGEGTSGWWKTLDQFASVASVIADPGPPAAPRRDALTNAGVDDFINWGTVGIPGCLFNNRLYYAADGYTQGTDFPPIRVFDGTVDRQLCRLPYNNDVGVGTIPDCVMSMATLGGSIYVTTRDGGDANAGTIRARVFSLDPSTGDLTQLGSTFPAGHFIIGITSAFGRLWVATVTDLTTAGRVYFYRPGIDTDWTLDHTLAAGLNGTCLQSFRGDLYLGTITNGTPASIVKKRTATGTWSTEDTGTTDVDAASGYLAMAVFNSALYVSWQDQGGDGTKIRKFDGSTWSTAYSLAGGGVDEKYVLLTVINGKIYAVSSVQTTTGGVSGVIRQSSDGATWTDRTDKLSTAQTAVPLLVPILVGS